MVSAVNFITSLSEPGPSYGINTTALFNKVHAIINTESFCRKKEWLDVCRSVSGWDCRTGGKTGSTMRLRTHHY